MGHINRGYEPVSTEDIHSVCAEPDPGGSTGHSNSTEPKPAPRSARKKEPTHSGATTSKDEDSSNVPNAKPTPVKSARVRHNVPKAEAQ